MLLTDDPRVRAHLIEHPHRLLFASLSGAHLYGFESVDSDVDVRGAHLLPLQDVLRVKQAEETFQRETVVDGLEVDTVTYDLRKFIELLLKKNGNVIEQLASEHRLVDTQHADELREIARRCVCRHHVHHYRGMTGNRLRAFAQEPRVKYLLYAYRAVLTGIHLLRTGEVEANLPRLADTWKVDVAELVERKRHAERGLLSEEEVDRWRRPIDALQEELQVAFDESDLPESPAAAEEAEAFLVRVRLEPVG